MAKPTPANAAKPATQTGLAVSFHTRSLVRAMSGLTGIASKTIADEAITEYVKKNAPEVAALVAAAGKGG